MNWLALIKAFLVGFAALITWLKSRQAIEAATADILSKQLKKALEDVKKADEARLAVRNGIDAGKLRDTDKFERSE